MRAQPGRAGLPADLGSWLNWIEAEFADLRYFARGGTDHHSHTEQNAAIAAYVRWRNSRARPKVNFATDSQIRTWKRMWWVRVELVTDRG